MSEISQQEYLQYLVSTYGGKGDPYYRQFLTAPLGSNSTVLDWGCGLGGMLELVSKLYPEIRIHGLDMNPECVRHVKERHPDWNVVLLPLPGLAAPYPDQTFDRIFLLDVVEHCKEPEKLLNECHRLLSPGGILTLSTPDRLAYHKPLTKVFPNFLFNLRHLAKQEWLDPTHVTEYSISELQRLLNAAPFVRHDLIPSAWRYIPWLRPPKRYYSFVVNLFRAI